MNNIPADLWETLSDRFLPTRQEKLLEVAKNRILDIALVVQDVHDPHNISACLRSADAFGVHHCFIVDSSQKYKASTVSRGVDKWLQIEVYPTIRECAMQLEKHGYRVFAAMPKPQAHTLHSLPLPSSGKDKIAVVFGNEHAGVSSEWDQYADGHFTIPMFGMVESLNISVSAAITMEELTHRWRQENKDNPFLEPSKQTPLLNQWTARQLSTWEKEYRHLKTAKQ